MIVIVNLKNLSDSAHCPFEMGSQAFHAKSLWLQIMTITTPTYVDVVRDAWYCYRGGADKDGAMFEEEGCSVGRWAGQDTVRQWGGLVENRGSVSELRTGPTPLHANQLSTTNTTLPGVTSPLGPRSSISIQNQSKPPVSFIPKLRVAQYVKPNLWERFFEDY